MHLQFGGCFLYPERRHPWAGRVVLGVTSKCLNMLMNGINSHKLSVKWRTVSFLFHSESTRFQEVCGLSCGLDHDDCLVDCDVSYLLSSTRRPEIDKIQVAREFHLQLLCSMESLTSVTRNTLETSGRHISSTWLYLWSQVSRFQKRWPGTLSIHIDFSPLPLSSAFALLLKGVRHLASITIPQHSGILDCLHRCTRDAQASPTC